MFKNTLVVIKGAGDLATGVGFRLFRCGFPVVMTELPQPTHVRRTVAFAEAVYKKETTVEGITAQLIETSKQIGDVLLENKIPVIVDPQAVIICEQKPQVVVDARIAKRNLGTKKSEAALVIGLGPGFTAGVDVHAVIETNRGHNLGRVILDGTAEPNTGIPGIINGYGKERVLRSPIEGIISPVKTIGNFVGKGDLIAKVGREPVLAPFDGILRGLIRGGITVYKGMKIGDVDPQGSRDHCYKISDKALAIGGGVLEAILMQKNHENNIN